RHSSIVIRHASFAVCHLSLALAAPSSNDKRRMTHDRCLPAAYSKVMALTSFNLMIALLSSLTSLPLVRRTPATIDPPKAAKPPTAAAVGMPAPPEDAIPDSTATVTPA